MVTPRIIFRLLAVTLAMGVASSALAKKKRGRKIGILPIGKHRVSDDLIAAVDLALLESTGGLDGEFIGGSLLMRRIKNPVQAVSRCYDDRGCLAKLARKAKLDLVVVGRVTSGTATPVVVTLWLLGADGELESESSMTLHTSADAPAEAVAAMGAMIDTVTDEPEPVAAEPVVAEGDPMMPALEGLELAALPDAPEDAPPPITEVEAAPVDSVAAAPPEERKPVYEERSAWLMWTGVAVAAAGAAGAGVGAVFGLQANGTKSDIDPAGPKSTPQITALDLEQKHNSDADRANLLFVIGGAAAVVGIGMILIDVLLLDDGRDADAWATPTEDGAAVLIRF